jgi:hypothetical protein
LTASLIAPDLAAGDGVADLVDLALQRVRALRHHRRLLGDPLDRALQPRGVAEPAAHALRDVLEADALDRLREAERLQQRGRHRPRHARDRRAGAQPVDRALEAVLRRDIAGGDVLSVLRIARSDFGPVVVAHRAVDRSAEQPRSRRSDTRAS